MARLLLVVALALSLAPPDAAAREAAGADALDALLEEVRAGRAAQREANRAREVEFRRRKQEQAQLLAEAQSAREALERRSVELEAKFQRNESEIEELEERLESRLGNLGELFGVVRQVAGDTRAHLQSSLVSAELPGRAAGLDALAESKRLPGLEELTQLWFALQQEATEAGKVVRFRSPVVGTDGRATEREVLRIGPFTALSADGDFLQYTGGALRELARPPGRLYARAAARYAAGSEDGVAPIDPSLGSVLALEVQRPTWAEQVERGGFVAYVILAIGAAGLLLALGRLAVLLRTGRSMQRAASGPDDPLARVLEVYEHHPEADTDTLELKLDEAVLRETPRLERGITTIRVLSVIAPLLGLLGTVTGMIRTFQMITLFGTGDPKLMAGGISEALVTTMLGLIVAIPLTFLASLLRDRAKELTEILEERAAGMVAERCETRGRAAS